MGQNDLTHDVPKAGKPRRGFGHRGGVTEGIGAGLQREPRSGKIATSSQKIHTAGSSFGRNWLAWRSGSSLRIRFGPLALAVLLAAPLGPSWADADGASAAVAVAGEVAQKQKLRALFPDPTASAQTTPPVIPQLEIDDDSSGTIATFQPNGSTPTASNAFFQNLGSNGRTCFTCHQPQDGWSLSAQHAQARFNSDPNDPLFRRVDGATCPSADVSTLAAQRAAYSLLTNKGLIRIGLPMQSTMEFQILDVNDPYGCDNNPITGLTGSKSGILSFYRRPLPSTNLGFLSTIMWDGREPDLFQQSVDATLGHAQGNPPGPSPYQQQQIVTFEGCTTANNSGASGACAIIPKSAGIFTAQLHDNAAGELTAAGANGGPAALATSVTKFFIGINDSLGLNPSGAPFNPMIFDIYNPWADLNGQGGGAVAARKAIARGQQVFNSVAINITGVGGLNDLLNQPSISGPCGTCHDTPDVGNHSVKAPLNIGIANAGPNSPPALDISGLPVFTLWCTSGPLAGKTFQVTDVGRAMISGKCADIGKVKGPVLRGLAARAPYFHNGSAATLSDVVEFYNQRFGIGLTAQQKADLVAFLNSL
jgi:cytochrome c peroxidase